MREAVIVSTVSTPIRKAYRGALNATQVPMLAARAMQAAVSRAGLEGGEIEDFTMARALTQGCGAINVARHAVFAAGLPDTVAAATIDRQCASGLSAIAIAAAQVRCEGLILPWPVGQTASRWFIATSGTAAITRYLACLIGIICPCWKLPSLWLRATQSRAQTKMLTL